MIDKSVDVGKIGVDWSGEYTFEGDELLSAALDIAGVFDPTGAADIANASLQFKNGEVLGAAISAIGVIPYAGDLAKAAKIGKDVKAIGNAIGCTQKHHIIPRAVYRDNTTILEGILKRDSKQNLINLPSGFHSNHPAYNKWIQKQIDDAMQNSQSLSLEQLLKIMRDATKEIDNALHDSNNLNSYFKLLNQN